MMDMTSAYSVGSFEMRLLTYGVHLTPDNHRDIDAACLDCFTDNSDTWLSLDFGFHSCSYFEDGTSQVIHVTFMVLIFHSLTFILVYRSA